jgi:hypothetical protein
METLSSSKGPGGTRVNSAADVTAQAWEESLAQMNLIADSNLAKMASMQRSFQPTRETPSESFSRSQLTYASVRPQQPARAQSAPRNARSGGDLTASNLNPNLVATATNDTERKLDFLMKRTRQLEEKLKRNERGNLVNNETAALSCSTMEQIIETQKADKRLILGLKESCAAMKAQMDQLLFRDDVRDKSSQRPTPSVLQTVDLESIKEVVFYRVQADFNHVIEEVAKTCAIEQASYLSAWAEREKQEREKAYFGGLNASNAISVFQSELSKLQSDMMRVKGRQDSVDNALIELRDVASVRNLEFEKDHKQAISSYRTEFQIVVDSIGRNVNDQLSALSTSNTEKIAHMEQVLVRHENETLRLAANQQVVEDIITEVRQNVASMRSTATLPIIVAQCEEKSAHALNVASLAEASCRRSAECAENVMKLLSQSQQASMAPSNPPTSGSIALLEVRINSAVDTVHSVQTALDRLSTASLTASEGLEQRLESLALDLHQEKLDRIRETAHHDERVKRLRSKMREFVNNLGVVSSMRETIDHVLLDLNSRKTLDDEKLHQFFGALEKYHQDLSDLNIVVSRFKEDVKSKFSQIQERHAGLDTSSQFTAELQKLKLSAANHERSIGEIQLKLKSSVLNNLEAQKAMRGEDDDGKEKRLPRVNDVSNTDRANFHYDNKDDDPLDDTVSVNTSKSSESEDIYDFKVQYL